MFPHVSDFGLIIVANVYFVISESIVGIIQWELMDVQFSFKSYMKKDETENIHV